MSHETHDAKSGRFAPKEQDPATTVDVQEDRLTPFMKEGINLLRSLENEADDLQRYVWLHCINVHCAGELRVG